VMAEMAREVAHEVAVMYAGQVMEMASVDTLFSHPRHPYAAALLAALPEHNQGARRLAALPGIVPGRHDRPAGCLLAPRCAYVQPRCQNERPALQAHDAPASAESAVRCFFPLAMTARVDGQTHG